MGCNREIAKRRIRLADKSSEPATQHQPANETASIDEIVRYLRQQDDVVVSQEDGWYLVNGRFRMSVAELAARANRIRSRQQKPAFPNTHRRLATQGQFWAKAPSPFLGRRIAAAWSQWVPPTTR
jgi:hypothetical protein